MLNNIEGDVDIKSGLLTSVYNLIDKIFSDAVVKDVSDTGMELRSGCSLPEKANLLRDLSWTPVKTYEIFLE